MHHNFFVQFFTVFERLNAVKMPNFDFYEDADKQQRNVISFSDLRFGPSEFNFKVSGKE